MSRRPRTTPFVSLAAVALALVACGDDETSTSSGGDGGNGGGTTAATTAATSTSTSTQSGGGQGGEGTGGEGQGGDGDGGSGGLGGEGGQGGQGGEPPPEASSLLVASNPTGRDGDMVHRLPLELAAPDASHGALGLLTSLESADVDDDGDGWISVDRAGATGGLLFVDGLATAASGTLGGGTRRVEGPTTGLMTPKGVRIVEDLELVLVADTTARDIKAFARTADGDEAPLFVVSDLGNDLRAVWDIDYDPSGDRLYAAGTDGVVLVFDDFSTLEGADGPTRTITPTDGTAKISVNLHGIELVPGGILDPEMLVLTDVGDAAVATDGQLFTIANPAGASGDTPVRARFAGATTLLGNPVDLDVVGDDVFVAEKSNDRILRFDGVTAAVAGTQDVAPSAQVAVTKAESVVAVGTLFPQLVTVSNPALRDADAVVRLDGTLLTTSATLGNLGVIQSIQSAIVADDGAVFATLDLAGTRGAVMVVDGLASAPSGAALAGGTRRIEGDATGLVAPKGLQLATLGGTSYLLVADAGAPRDIKVFAADAEGDEAPAALIEDLGADRAPWDIDYDPTGDRLYVACTDGTLLVFDDFSALADAGPTRTIMPAVAGVDVAVNLHGVSYLAGTDTLVLSDVGDAAVATDGQVFTIAAASTAMGLVDVRARILGAATLLGNPVAIDVANGAVYVAEKSNDRILRWNAIETLTGEITVAADQAVQVTKPESVFVRYE